MYIVLIMKVLEPIEMGGHVVLHGRRKKVSHTRRGNQLVTALSKQ